MTNIRGSQETACEISRVLKAAGGSRECRVLDTKEGVGFLLSSEQ